MCKNLRAELFENALRFCKALAGNGSPIDYNPSSMTRKWNTMIDGEVVVMATV